MPLYRYKAISGGKVVHGELKASSQLAAIEELRNTGHLPVSAIPVEAGRRFTLDWLQRFRGDKHISQKQVSAFTRELATLLHAGLPLDMALQMLQRTSGPSPIGNLIETLRSQVQAGSSFSDALTERPDVFRPLYVHLVRAGEAGGTMDVSMERLAAYLERMEELQSTVITALIYPGILIVVAGLSLFALMTFVVPQFVPLFEDAGATLPLLTRIVFFAAELFRGYWWLLLCLLAAAVWFADKQLADPVKRLRFDAWLLRLPYLGEVVRGMDTASMARTLGTLLGNGVPLLAGVRLVRDVIGNRALAACMDEVVPSLEQGQTMTAPLKKPGLWPPLAVQLIEVGEESGQLEEMLLKTAEIFDREVQLRIRRLLTVLEPMLILGLGGVIAVIIMSVLVAILGLNELIA